MWGWATCHALGILMYILLVRGGIDGVGVASGKEYYRELLEECRYLWCGGRILK